MVYLLNSNLSDKKKLKVALKKIYGLGSHQRLQICHDLGISPDKRIKQLSSLEFEKLTQLIAQNYDISIDIKRNIIGNIERLIKIGCYRGFRHVNKLPVRGQRTHGNSKTSRKLHFIFDRFQK